MDTEIFKRKISPFQEKYNKIYVMDLIYTRDILEEMKFNRYLTKEILTDDIKGYMEAHDIDPNIYRYVYTIEATPDMVRQGELQILLNGAHIMSYLDKNNDENMVTFDGIRNKVQEYDKEKRLYLGDSLYPILKEDPYPYETLVGRSKQWASDYIEHHPNVKRYKEEDIDTTDDDDHSDMKIHHEDDKYKKWNKEMKWLKIRVEIIHHHLYLFSVNPFIFNSMHVISVDTDLAELVWDLRNEDLDNNLILGYYGGKNRISFINHIQNLGTDLGNSNFFLKIKYNYFKIDSQNNIQTMIKEYVEENFPENYSYCFDANDVLKPEFVMYFLSKVSFRDLIILVKQDKEIDYRLWELTPDAEPIGRVFTIYRGNFHQTIIDWFSVAEVFDPEDIYYGYDIIRFNRLTNNNCKHLLPNTQNAIDLPDNYDTMKDKKLAEYIRDTDYDLFITYHKISHEINKRWYLDEMEIVDVTEDGLEHKELEGIHEYSNKFFKFTVPNYRRNPFDLYLCERLYTGKMIVEREYHHTHIYIPIVQLWKFIVENDMVDLLPQKLYDVLGVYRYV